jgi:hypothetical protein
MKKLKRALQKNSECCNLKYYASKPLGRRVDFFQEALVLGANILWAN